MNKIEFKLRKPLDINYNQNVEVVDILIDEESLVNLIDDFELRFHPAKPTGEFNYDGTSRNWLIPRLKEKSMVYVLGCGACLEPGCWPIEIDIEEKPTSIIWKNFRNPYHSHKDNPKQGREYWDYSSFPFFEFSKEEYLDQIHKLEKLDK